MQCQFFPTNWNLTEVYAGKRHQLLSTPSWRRRIRFSSWPHFFHHQFVFPNDNATSNYFRETVPYFQLLNCYTKHIIVASFELQLWTKTALARGSGYDCCVSSFWVLLPCCYFDSSAGRTLLLLWLFSNKKKCYTYASDI